MMGLGNAPAQAAAGNEGGSKPMFAVAVPNALEKPLRVLYDELEGDHVANA